MNKLTILIALVLLVGCTSNPITVPTSTPSPIPTSTQEPTNTPDLSADRRLVASALQEWCKGQDKKLRYCEVSWEGTELKIKGYVSGYPEPEDHEPIQFDFLRDLAFVAKFDEIAGFSALLREDDTITVVSVGLLSEISMLSQTPSATFLKIIDRKITTRAEWLAEAKIVN